MDESIKLPAATDRVFVSMEYAGFRAMQVCVLPEVPDDEILRVCNQENPQKVSGGWHTVVRDEAHAREIGISEESKPGSCVDCPGRLHKIVVCM